MIRYDCVWEHISILWNKKTVYYEKFDGTEEINGKTYHRLVSFRKASYDYDADGKPYVFDVDENYYRHEGSMREEGGKVYTLLSDVEYQDDFYNGNLYIPDDNKEHPADLQEKLLYDFTCGEGESYSGLQVDGSHFAEEFRYDVESIESVEIDGEEHRLMKILPGGWDYPHGEPIVEGVGITSYGCLNTINFLWLPTCPCMDYMFSRVLDMDGKEVYREDKDPSRIPIDFLGVGSIAEQAEETAPIYDLYGRRISVPAPGQLYIQGGKKYIAN